MKMACRLLTVSKNKWLSTVQIDALRQFETEFVLPNEYI